MPQSTVETEAQIVAKGLTPGDFWAVVSDPIPDGEDRPLLDAARVDEICAELLKNPRVRARAEYNVARRQLDDAAAALREAFKD